jgi:hypothetical protein
MLRGQLILPIVRPTALITLPFLMSSLSVDQRGISISGHVYSEREDPVVRDGLGSPCLRIRYGICRPSADSAPGA